MSPEQWFMIAMIVVTLVVCFGLAVFDKHVEKVHKAIKRAYVSGYNAGLATSRPQSDLEQIYNWRREGF